MKKHTKKIITRIIVLVLAVMLALTFCIFPALAETANAPGVAVSVDLTQIVVSVVTFLLSVLLAWIAKVIVPPIKCWIDAKTTEEQRQTLNKIIWQLVEAAEQTIVGIGRGSERLKYVTSQLQERGYKVDLAAIEAAVKEMNDRFMLEALAITGDDTEGGTPEEEAASEE